ncbi:MAG: hypothetical protein IJ119_15930 [Clostridia bacterium]|nr:hypothetical protein [Clostridia bacterium]
MNADNTKSFVDRLDELQTHLCRIECLMYVVTHAAYDEMAGDEVDIEFRRSLPPALEEVYNSMKAAWDEASDLYWAFHLQQQKDAPQPTARPTDTKTPRT